jgi:rubrerythrin
MDRNVDEEILLKKRVDENSDIPYLHQVLRIAVYDEFCAYEAYSRVNEIYGETEPFVNIVEAEKEHYAMIVDLMEKYEVEMPMNDWCEKIEIPNEYIECCEKAVSAEINNIAMYEHLLEYVEEEDVRDVLYRLQAASYNNHLPAFRKAVYNHYSGANEVNANSGDFMSKAGEYQELVQSVMNGDVDQNKITKLLQNSNLSFIIGAALGGVATATVNNMINKDEEEDFE